MRIVSQKDPDDKDAARALDWFEKIIEDAKKPHPKGRRIAAHTNLTRRTLRMIAGFRNNPALAKPMKKIERALPDMFRFVLDPQLAADNNAAERELVVHRKVRGSIRSEYTMDWMGALFTCIMTWKNKGLDPMTELRKYI